MSSSVDTYELHYDYSKQTALLFVVFLLLYEISAYVANDMIMPGMIEVVRSFSAPESYVSTSLTAYIFGGGTLQIFLGPLSDRFGRRPVMISGVILFLFFTVFIAFSQNMQQFIWARFFQGMGLCFIGVIGYATLQEIFVETYAVKMVSIMNSITIIAPLAGPLLGAVIMHYFSWRVIFHIIAVFASIALIGIWYYMPETVGKQRRDGSIHSHTSLRLSVVGNNYLALIKNKRFLLGSVALGFLMIPIIAWIGTSPLILMKGAHLDVITYGIWQIPVFIASIVGNIAVRKALARWPLTRIAEIGALVTLVTLVLTAGLTYLVHLQYWGVIVGITAYSFALGYLGAPLTRLTLFSTMVPKGTASAFMSLIQMLIAGVGNELAGKIYSTYNNGYFSLYCMLTGVIFYGAFLLMNKKKHA